MDDISLVFLGTGTSTGVPVVACDCPVCTSKDPRDVRLRTSALVNIEGKNIVIDCGPDFRYQMIREKVEDIDAILFTHGHRDHIAGIDDIRGFNYVLNKSIDIYASDEVLQAIKAEFPYIKPESRFFGCPQLIIHKIRNEDFLVGDITMTPVKVLHDKLEVFGFRMKNLCYITDASYISPEEILKIQGCDVLIINALRNSRHVSHFSLKEALGLISEINPRHAYITHLSHFIGLHADVQESLPENVHLAFDGLKIRIPDQ